MFRHVNKIHNYLEIYINNNTLRYTYRLPDRINGIGSIEGIAIYSEAKFKYNESSFLNRRCNIYTRKIIKQKFLLLCFIFFISFLGTI